MNKLGPAIDVSEAQGSVDWRKVRDAGIKVIYAAHMHRPDGCDMGLFDDLHPPIAHRAALVDGTALLRQHLFRIALSLR